MYYSIKNDSELIFLFELKDKSPVRGQHHIKHAGYYNFTTQDLHRFFVESRIGSLKIEPCSRKYD